MTGKETSERTQYSTGVQQEVIQMSQVRIGQALINRTEEQAINDVLASILKEAKQANGGPKG